MHKGVFVNMTEKKYYIGLDIGTNSVGYAVTDEQYNLCKFKGKPMWGVTLFDEAQSAADRRKVRSARRRLDRRQQRVQLIIDLFAKEIAKVDEGFFKRIKESYLYPENTEDKVRLFNTYDEQKAYVDKYPTIHHLIVELMNSTEPHDVRLVYIACAWLVAHRGHFLSEVDKHNIEAVTQFDEVYKDFVSYVTRDNEYDLPWRHDIDVSKVANVLKTKKSVRPKAKALAEVLFDDGKAPKVINEKYEYNYDLVMNLLCGGKVNLKDLFGKSEYEDLEEKSVALNMDDEKLGAIMLDIGDDAQFISLLKKVYDWSVLVDVLGGKQTISDAKVAVYEQHNADLKLLKRFVKKYISVKYNDIFRSKEVQNNYASYVGKNNTENEDIKVKKSNNKIEFCRYILSVVKNITPDEDDLNEFQEMLKRLEVADFMSKQVDSDNRVIPYQLYWYELNRILENAKTYIPFLEEKDIDGITGAEKILSIFEFRVPYYVGPLKEKSNPKLNHWMVRKAEGKIYPWNFNDKVDLDKSEDSFISRMTNTCSYLPGEDVLPKNSLIYCAFEVLNEINNIKINGCDIPVDVKQNIYQNVFMQKDKVTLKSIKQYLIANGYICDDDVISGLDITVKSSLKPFRAFKNLVQNGLLSYSDAEKIITRAAYSEDNSRLAKWIHNEYPSLPESEVKYISKLKFKNFGRLSRKLLCGITGIDKEIGETFSVIRAMWETNNNLMQLLSDKFTFSENIEKFAAEYYDLNPKSISERLDEMYVSNKVKRPIIRTLDIMKDIVKVQRQAPEMIFIEMARDAADDQKGNRTKSRLDQIREFYTKVKDEDVRNLSKLLDEWGDTAHNKLQSDKLFLYFIQLGKCLYTCKPIDINALISGDNSKYNIEHIYPRSFVKDDSVINNKILVDSKVNAEKSDSYPIDSAIRNNMRGYWEKLNKIGLLGNEKFKRLTRTTPFTEDEKFEFINRQLVETRQSTKAVATLLKELYPETEIVYVKAGLVSDFRQQFKLPKSRIINDLHHAKDAYLNIVTGNVWHHKFSRRYYMKDVDNNVKPEIVYTRCVKFGNRMIWNGAEDKDRVVEIVKTNSVHMTMFSYCKHSGQNGGFFDQNPLRAKEGLIPLKNDMPTEIYGGYDSATVSGFVLARYRIGKKSEVSFVPLKLLYFKKFLEDDAFAIQYVENELGEKASDIEILFNKRIIKNYAMLSLDGVYFCIRGKAGLSDLGLMNMTQFIDKDFEMYIKRLESFDGKHKKNPNIVWNEKFDGISKDENIKLYANYLKKLTNHPYEKRPGNITLVEKLEKHTDDFEKLDVIDQVYTLLQNQGIFGRKLYADLKGLKESKYSGLTKLSLNLSNWRKTYKEVRIVDQSASGLFKKVSENLLDLL